MPILFAEDSSPMARGPAGRRVVGGGDDDMAAAAVGFWPWKRGSARSVSLQKLGPVRLAGWPSQQLGPAKVVMFFENLSLPALLLHPDIMENVDVLDVDVNKEELKGG
jgi:hypothetical protein